MKTTSPTIDLREPAMASLDWLSTLLHTTDSAYPIGGFAHSGGLEGMVQLNHIRTPEDLRRFMHQEIASTLGSVELPLLHNAWLAAMAEDDGLLQLLDQTSEAVRFAAEQRQASRRLGAQRWALMLRLQVTRLSVSERAWLDTLTTTLPHKHLCIVAGIEAAVLGLPVTAAMIALAHQTVMMVAQSAMKLMRVGQNTVQALVSEMTDRYVDLIEHAEQLDLEDLGTCLPRYDIATARHETAKARMFLS